MKKFEYKVFIPHRSEISLEKQLNDKGTEGWELISYTWNTGECILKREVIESNNLKLRYKCFNCGNTCLEDKKPDNSVCCDRCIKPDWRLMQKQEGYIVGQKDYIHPDGEI